MFRRDTPLPPCVEDFGFCPPCPYEKQKWRTMTKKGMRSFRDHIARSTHSTYGCGKDLWHCNDCDKTYPQKSAFDSHPCQKLKFARPLADGIAVAPTKYRMKTTDKQLHKEAKLWSPAIMYGVAYEEKWCLPGN